MKSKFYSELLSIVWNLSLLTIGTLLFAVGVQAVVIPNEFITGGMSGVGLLLYYATHLLSPGIWYFVINLPIFAAGYFFVGRKFFIYSIYGTVSLSVFMDLVKITIPLQDQFLSVIAGGVIIGTGLGICLHSLGSSGGTDIIGIILHQKFNIRIGTFFFLFNMVLFSMSYGILKRIDIILYSLVMSFIIAQVINYILSMFNQRKMVFIISEYSKEIADIVQHKLNRGATFLEGTGAYTGHKKKVLLTVIYNYQLKQLEQIVFKQDREAFMITENTFNVMGKGFSRPKEY